METFEAYFRRADLDSDGRISGAEAVNFFQGSNLPKHVLAQIWMYSDARKAGFLSREEFYNALKLVTVAQRGRELTPEIVKAVLESPAAAKIPAPQINATVAPPVGQMTIARPPVRSAVTAPSQISGFNPNSQVFTRPNGQQMRPNQASLAGQGFPGVLVGPGQPTQNLDNSGLSIGWQNGGMRAASSALSGPAPSVMVPAHVRAVSPPLNGPAPSVVGLTQPSPITSTTQALPTATANPPTPSTKTVDPLSSLQSLAKNSNGFSSDSVFGGDLFSASSDSKHPTTSGISGSIIPTTLAGNVPASVGPIQNAVVQGSLTGVGSLEVTQNRVTFAPPISTVGGPTGLAPRATERPWPKFSHSDILKYSKVFTAVDKDRDGKITGEEARTLFLSWKLPREILKQVWDLSDQDNDSMLSLREFVTALYLMERFREGYTLPPVLPNAVKFDETLLQATSQSSMPYSGQTWQPKPGGFLQPRMPSAPTSGSKPQIQSQESEKIEVQEQPAPRKKSIPVLENHLIYQLSKEEQEALKSKFEEATNADKKVNELEKEILDSQEKIEFYRTKMQELVLYKSRCDSRLNEITEKAVADKRELDVLAKKYEEKYKNVGDVASTLTIEEATFQDIQEKKLELYRAIVKIEEGGNANGALQVRADGIQSEIDVLIKSLNERCKKYGLRAKPTTLLELPFGWQPRIQDGAADWDGDWDKYEDDGFALVKELSTDEKNIIAPPKTKSPVPATEKVKREEISPPATEEVKKEEISSPVSPAPSEKKVKIEDAEEETIEGEAGFDRSEAGSVKSPSDSPAGRRSLDSASQLFNSPRFSQNGTSPRLREDHLSDQGGPDSSPSNDNKFGDDMFWGTSFDTRDEADSVWDFNSKDSFSERKANQSSVFDSGDFGLSNIRTAESPSARSVFGQEKSPFFTESVPGTPQYYSTGFSPRFGDGPNDQSFDSFGRFDSLSHQDSRFDSFSQRETLARFDSIRSTSDQSRSGFFSFDDPDPFGSTGPFKTTSETPRRTSDQWNAF